MPLGLWTPALVDRLAAALGIGSTTSESRSAADRSPTAGSAADADRGERGAFESHPDPLLRVTGDDRIVAANAPAEEILDGDESVVGTRVEEHLDAGTDGDVLERELAGTRHRFEPTALTDPRTGPGGLRWIHFRRTDTSPGPASPDAGPASTAQTGTFEQYETIMQVLPDPVYATDATGTLTFVNRAFEERFGIDRTTVAESDIHFSAITTDHGAESIAETLRSLLETDTATARETIESTVVTADGRHLTVENSLALRPTHGGFAGAAGVLRDVTERQRREEILSVMDRALRHNLRTNVNIIAGYAETLESEVGDENVEALRTIGRAATWLGKLGETIRTLEQSIDATPETDQRIDIERLVTDCASWARERYPSASIDVTVSAYGEIDAGDPLEIALRNVVENAIVHNDSAEPAVDVWVTDAPQEGWVELSVADDGPGIPTEERAVVLGTTMPTQLTHGSGLGLWLTSWIVQVFDGDVEIQENDPRGSVVTLRLRRMLSDRD